MIRCKFKLESITEWSYGQYDYSFAPVYSNDPNHENKRFWDATPSGSFKMGVKKPLLDLKVGSEYYIDIHEG